MNKTLTAVLVAAALVGGALFGAGVWNAVYPHLFRTPEVPWGPVSPIRRPDPFPLPTPKDVIELLFFSQDGCLPCDQMWANVLTDPGVRAHLASRNVVLRRHHNDRDAFRKWHVEGTPTCRLIRTSPNGEVFTMGEPLVGNANAPAFRRWLDGTLARFPGGLDTGALPPASAKGK